MRKLNKPMLIMGAAAALSLASIGASAIHAASSTASTNPMSGLVQAIATKFNLKTDDVQAVFDAQKAQMDAQRQADFKTRLDQAVTDGKLTKAQEDLIVAKQAEQKTFMDSLSGMAESDRQTAVQANQAALTKWATDNAIPQQYIPFGPGGRGGHGGPGGRHGADAPANAAASPTPASSTSSN